MFLRKQKLEPALPAEMRLRYAIIDKIPKINWIRYYALSIKNRSWRIVKIVFMVLIPLCFLILLIMTRPDVQPPGEIAAKLAQLNNINAMLVILNISIVLIKCFRIPIPRNEYM